MERPQFRSLSLALEAQRHARLKKLGQACPSLILPRDDTGVISHILGERRVGGEQELLIQWRGWAAKVVKNITRSPLAKLAEPSLVWERGDSLAGYAPQIAAWRRECTMPGAGTALQLCHSGNWVDATVVKFEPCTQQHLVRFADGSCRFETLAECHWDYRSDSSRPAATRELDGPKMGALPPAAPYPAGTSGVDLSPATDGSNPASPVKLLAFVSLLTPREEAPPAENEAVEVATASSLSAAVNVALGGISHDLRDAIDAFQPTHLHLAPSPGESSTFGFLDRKRALVKPTPAALAQLLSPFVDRIDFVFLNFGLSLEHARHLRAEGIRVVVCWSTDLHPDAARIMACSFYMTWARTKDVVVAYRNALMAICLITRPAQQPDGTDVDGNTFVFEDPITYDPATSLLTPPPIPVGIPVLLL